MYRPNLLKARLLKGEKVFGSWNVLASAFATEVMGYAGFDFIILDHEHGCGDLMTLGHQFQALSPTPTAALVRVPSHDTAYIRRVLDLGAEGVVVPSVNTADEARAIVQACHYPKFGSRGAAPGTIRASNFGAEASHYARTAGENTLVICQIETVEGVANAAEIAAVEGVDMLFIGPFDLSASAGFMGEMDHPEVVALIEKVETVARAADKPLGSILRPGVSLKEVYDRGYQLISTGSDSSRLRAGCVADVAKFREAIGSAEAPKVLSVKAG